MGRHGQRAQHRISSWWRRPWLSASAAVIVAVAAVLVPVLPLRTSSATAAGDQSVDPAARVLLGWGQLSGHTDGAVVDYGTTPKPIPQLPGAVKVSAVAGGVSYALALGSDGAIYAWGYNDHGQLGTGNGNGTYTAQPDPARVLLPDGVRATAVTTAPADGWGQSLAVGSDGLAYVWGDVGDCNPARERYPSGSIYTPVPLPLPPDVHARQVAGGESNTYILGDDGNVYATGVNTYGQLGTGSTATGYQCTPVRVALPDGVTATDIAANGDFALATGSDGHLYSWGRNYEGVIGNGTGTDARAPVQVRLPAGVRPIAISAGSAFGLAAGSDGHLYAWGSNFDGRLGDGTTDSASAPVRVALPDGVSPTTISAGSLASLAVGSDGHLYAWGANYDGRLGDGTTTDSHTPVQVHVPADAPVHAIAAGSGFGLAAVGTVAPSFSQASPPSRATAGATLTSTFIATGFPTPAYALAPGAPGWLSIDPATGELTGRLPADASTFSFSVTATSSAGTATAGPFTVTVPARPVDVAGTVTDGAGGSVTDAIVDVCTSDGSVCQHVRSDASGAFSTSAEAGSVVVATAYPPQGRSLGSGSTGTLAVPAAGLSGLVLRLPTPGPLGAGVSVTAGAVGETADGQVVLHWQRAATMRVASCPNGTGLVTLVGQNSTTSEFEYRVYPLTESPVGSGIYTGTVPPQYPIHGPVNIQQSVACGDQTGVQPQYGLTGGGETVTITGTGLQNVTGVRFGTAAGTSVQSVSDGLLTVTVPAGSGTVPVVITLASGDSLLVGHYTYVSANEAPGLDQAGYRNATAGPGQAPALPQSTQPDSAGARPLTATPAALLAATTTSDNSSILATIAKALYNYFPGPQATTLRSAVATALLALHPTCESRRAAVKAAVHVLVAAAVLALVTYLSPLLVFVAESLLSGLTTPLGAILLAPVLPWLVKATVSFIINKLLDTLIDAGIDALLGKCDEPQTNALIDPSGAVLDTNGNPVQGATVTILRSDSESGPFTPVDVSLPGIEPATNPETTGDDGLFHWDVRSGYYEVQASKTGCTVPGHADQDTATIGPYPVPPPQLGLTITLQCPDEPPPPTPRVDGLSVATGPPAGGTELIIFGSGFTPAATVTVGGASTTDVTYLGPNAIQIITPTGRPGPADVVVHTAGGASASSSSGTFTYGSTPQITGLSVSEGPTTGGTRVTIAGSGFTGATVVGFGAMPGTALTVTSDTQLSVTTSAVAAAGAVEVEVLTPIGANPPGGSARFTYTDVPAPAGPGEQKITFPGPAAMTYGDPDQTLNATTTAAGLGVTYAAAPASVCTVRDGHVHVAGAGTCTITASQAGDDQYAAAAPVARTLTVTRATLTVTARDATMVAGGSLPAVLPDYAGLVGADTPAVLDTAPTCVAHVATGTTTCAGAADANYRIEYRPGTLTIRTAGSPRTVDPRTPVTAADVTAQLADTGTNLGAPLTWAVLALLLGCGLTLVARPRRRA